MKAIVCAVVVAWASAATAADVMAVLNEARDVGRMLAAEKFCKLPNDQAKLEVYYGQKTSQDPRFAGWVQQGINEAQDAQRTMTVKDRDRHCDRMRQISVAIGVVPDSRQVAEDFGTVLASEKLCGLTFNPSGIRSFIEANILPNDVGFSANLSGQTALRKLYDKDLTESEIVARCSQVKRVAAQYGMID